MLEFECANTDKAVARGLFHRLQQTPHLVNSWKLHQGKPRLAFMHVLIHVTNRSSRRSAMRKSDNPKTIKEIQRCERPIPSIRRRRSRYRVFTH